MESKIVIGLNFGDEGKGLTTSFLCSKTKNPIVVRFNGGHQAGHTVVRKGERHIFSSFGSGTLHGVPTYWSKDCTFYPSAFVVEREQLIKKLDNLGEKSPLIYVDPLCPVTTPFDVEWNQTQERGKRHGSVGVGFGSTIERHEKYFKLYVQDLYFKDVLVAKLKNIENYYNSLIGYDPLYHFDKGFIDQFLEDVEEAKRFIKISTFKDAMYGEEDVLRTPVFEGAQGVLLDMDFGFFPNVTRSNTTSKNAISLMDSTGSHLSEIYYVTRTYLTRHGAGFLPDEKTLLLANNENETNKKHEYQGDFRTARTNIELLNYALQCDSHFTKGKKKNLVITCMDQYPIDVNELLGKLNTNFEKVFISRGDSLEDIKQHIW